MLAQALCAGCSDTHGIANGMADASAADAAVDASVDARVTRPDANADANAPLAATTATYLVDDVPVGDAWVIFGDVDGEVVEVARTDAEGRASSLRFEEGIVTAVGPGWPPLFEVRTEVRRGDALRFGQSNRFSPPFVRVNLVANEPFAGAVRYRIAGSDAVLGVPVPFNDFATEGRIGVLAEALDASGSVVAQSWLETTPSEGATLTFPEWGTSEHIAVERGGTDSIVLQVAVAGTYRRVSVVVGDIMHVPSELLGRPARIVATTSESGSRAWDRRATLTTDPIVITLGPSTLCGTAYATSPGPRPTLEIPPTSGDQTSVLVVANSSAAGRLSGHRSVWWISTNPAFRQAVRLPAIPAEFTDYQATALAELRIYTTGREASATSGFEQARTTLGPVGAHYDNGIRVTPDSLDVSCTRSATATQPDSDRDGLPDASDPCPRDSDDNC